MGLPYGHTDFGRPGDHTTYTPVEEDSLRHLMQIPNGTVSGNVSVGLHGISEDRFMDAMVAYGATRDMRALRTALPPGSFSIALSREQLETAARVHATTVANNEAVLSREVTHTSPLPSLADYLADPLMMAYASIGSGNSVPLSVFETYFSGQGLSQHGESEWARLSRQDQP
jgi:hypothetical protein